MASSVSKHHRNLPKIPPNCYIPLQQVPKPEDGFNIVYIKGTKSIFVIHKTLGLLKYSIKTNSWIKFESINWKSSDDLISTQTQSLFHTPITTEGNNIYVCDCDSSAVKILTVSDYNNQQWKISTYSHASIPHGATVIMINDELHSIGGYCEYSLFPKCCHIKFNNQKDEMHCLYAFEDHSVGGHNIVKINNKLLLFGESNNKIFEYDILDSWSVLKVKLPTVMWRAGCTTVLNDQYVIFFVSNGPLNHPVDIYYYSIVELKFTKSKLKPPFTVNCPSGYFKALSVNDKYRDTIITFGYVRTQWRSLEISDHLFPPEYLIRIISNKYYLNEYVHLFTHHGHHWKIDVFDILS